jgi:hypothetical protein
MAVQNKRGINTSKNNVIVIDSKDDDNRKVEAKGMMQLSRLVRESKFMVKRCIMAIHDPDITSFFNIPASDNRRYAMIEVCQNNKNSNLELVLKMLKINLSSNKYKVVAEKIFKNSEYPYAKIVVKF